MPSVTFFPTFTRKGMPTRSASLNFTPGRSSRSSSKTSYPAPSSCRAMSSAALRIVSSFGVRGHHHHLERRNRRRQPEPVLVVILLDRRRQNALDPNPVAPHDRRHFLAVLVEHPGAHRFRILVAQLEDVSNLDGFIDAQRARRNSGSLRLRSRCAGRRSRVTESLSPGVRFLR